MPDLTVFHIPVCPFCQRLEILLTLKGLREAVRFQVIDATRPRPDWLLEKTGGTTALPVLETVDGHVLKESLIILQYLEDLFPEPPVAEGDPYRRAVENMLILMESGFATAGYGLILNQSLEQRDDVREEMLGQYRRLNQFLVEHAPVGPFLHRDFGWAEVVFTPLFMRFWLHEYYEDLRLPDDGGYERVQEWRDACVAHPASQQVSREQIVKLYYDYALGARNASLLPGRQRSSFELEPDWRDRPWPPKDKYGENATDEDLGL